MFDWFIANARGSVRHSLEEYIEDIIEEGFEEKEYEQAKLSFIENMLEKMEKGNSDWNEDYEVGKWVVRYLKILEGKESSRQQIEEVRKKYWNNLAVRKYCMDTSNRKQYIYMVSLLQRMQQIKGGTKIVEDWKEKYKNRPAMMDELSKL